MKMAALLDQLPSMENFLGKLDLKTGSLIIAAISVVHPFAYGCTLFMPLSYLIFTIWFLLAAFFATSMLLFLGLIDNNILFIEIWIWYSLVFVVTMVLLMILLSIVLVSRKHRKKVFLLIFGILWYVVTVYFVLVVNSHRKTLTPTTSSSQDDGRPSNPPPSDGTQPEASVEPATEVARMGRSTMGSHPITGHAAVELVHEDFRSTDYAITRYPPTNFPHWYQRPKRTSLTPISMGLSQLEPESHCTKEGIKPNI